MAGTEQPAFGTSPNPMKPISVPGENRFPSPKEVAEFHVKSDKDGSLNAQHHTLGPGESQASPGSHTHRGGDSKQLLAGITISGARGGNTALTSVIAALVELGASDTTTA